MPDMPHRPTAQRSIMLPTISIPLKKARQALPTSKFRQVVGRETKNADGTKKAYRPKVSTWGVFERPDNISKEFGGGRKISLGGEEETEEQKEETEKETEEPRRKNTSRRRD